MGETWRAVLTKKAHETQAPYLLPSKMDPQLDERRLQEETQFLPYLAKDIEMPKGFEFRKEGLYFVPSNEEKPPVFICSEFVGITGRYENITDGTEGIIVSWSHNNKWKKLKRSRDNFMIQSKLVELSALGFPVSSLNQRLMVQYLIALERVNFKNIPVEKASEQMGWNEEGFLLGNEFIGDGSLSFVSSDKGEEQFANHYNAKGDINPWLNMIEVIKPYPKVIAGVYASFASPLLSLFGSKPFIFEWSGETSKGKTTAQKIAASVWGKPHENGILKRWNSTPVAIERAASLTNHVPLFLDDTKQANPQYIAVSVYHLASGQGKNRGSIKGMQTTKNWDNVIFSTGEQKITSFSRDGGSAARVFGLDGLPFGVANDKTYNLVRKIERVLKKHYGLAGQIFIKYILDNRDKFQEWEDYFYQRTDYYAEIAKGNTVLQRLAEHMGIIDLAGILFHKCFNQKYTAEKELLKLWEEIIRDNQETDRPKQALEDVISWVLSEENRLYIWDREKNFKPFDCIGKWNEAKSADLCLYPVKLESFLKTQGYEPSAILKSWAERKWISTASGRMKKKVSVKNIKEWMYVLKINVVSGI
ncbi:DUF927 domain-containing protein [Priestia megaterium]|uniref:DUF927 domain-containing protein n=1 Tax=Priestia megaterium TaxID=1404 RepID=UPI003459511C